MDLQAVINWGVGLGLAVAGWLSRELWGEVKDLRSDVVRLREEIAKDYVSKDDFREFAREIKELLVTIDSKLDRKQDKGM